jgi:hypothetical protein
MEAAAAAAAAAGSNAADAATPAASPQRQQQQQLQQGIYSPGLTASELLPNTPMSLEELQASLQDPEVRDMFAKQMRENDIDSIGETGFDSIMFPENAGGCFCCVREQ